MNAKYAKIERLIFMPEDNSAVNTKLRWFTLFNTNCAYHII